MDQKTARQLAKDMSADSKNGSIFIATTDYALRGEFDEADAVWGVVNAGWPGDLLTEVPADYARPDEPPAWRPF